MLPCLLAVLRVPPLPCERHLGQVGAQLLHLHIGQLAMHTEGLAPPEPSGCVTHSPACVTLSPELRGCCPLLLLSDLPPHWCPHGGCGPRGSCGPRGQGLSGQAHTVMGLDTSRRATWRIAPHAGTVVFRRVGSWASGPAAGIAASSLFLTLLRNNAGMPTRSLWGL